MPDLLIVGYGKMGRMIEQLAPDYGFRVVAHVDADRQAALPRADVAVEFTEPSAVVKNIEELAAAGIPVVVGTTGWLKELPRVQKMIEQRKATLVWSANFSVGVNVFVRIAETAARLLKDEVGYGAWGWEMHHATKKDAPSGTMLKLVEAMTQAGFEREINVASSRAGAVPGIHEIGFDSAADTITLRHTARSREGFARGALKAAQWITDPQRGRKGCFEFSEILFRGK
jgi:4-hydroxy-tetrahydrodipicolinate reductase